SGDYIVYTSAIDGVVIYRISDAAYWSFGDPLLINEPHIDGDWIVWLSAHQVMVYNLNDLGTAVQAQPISGIPAMMLQIGDRFAVWVEAQDIVVWDLVGASATVVGTGAVDASPTTSGAWVAWVVAGSGSTGIEAFNMDTQAQVSVVDDGSLNLMPSMNGDLIAWESNAVGNFDIWVYRLSTGEAPFQVTVDPADQRLTDVYGNLVAYVDERAYNLDVWVSTLEFIPDENSVTLSGFLQYDGQPMSSITSVEPTFWCRNEVTKLGIDDITSTYNTDTGAYSIGGLPEVKVGVSAMFHIQGERGTLPGNYNVFKTVDIPLLSSEERANLDIGLQQVIHMTSPWDNDAIGPLFYPADPYPEHGGSLDFAWDAVPGATQYWIGINSYRSPDHPDGYGLLSNVLSSTIPENFLLVDLDPSGDLQHYQASILAYGSGSNVLGHFEISYENGRGWDYRFRVVGPSDFDGDGLSDDDELIYGTDPENPDTDGDGLMDGTEVDMGEGSGCPDPLDPDSDGDTLTDGDEVLNLGTNPCNFDTDGDGVPDNEDPLPNDPGVTSGFIEDTLRELSDTISDFDLSLFDGKNNNARAGRCNALYNKVNAAANAVAANDITDAIDQLTSILAKIDGEPDPKDWMMDSQEKEMVRTQIELLIALLELL
ncbi:MAG: TolB family protein, partial [Planctomycetota bacterium]